MIKNILVGLLCLALLIGGFLAGREVEHRRSVGEAGEVAEGHSREMLLVRGEAANWATAMSRAQGEALLRAFVSGVSPAILAERRDSLEMSAVSLLRVTGVSGVHILSPDGKVEYSSDAKLATTGELGDRGAWALGATELISREGAYAGVRDYAVPLISTGNVIAIVWLEFAETAVRDASRPPGLSSPNPGSSPNPDSSPKAGAAPGLPADAGAPPAGS